MLNHLWAALFVAAAASVGLQATQGDVTPVLAAMADGLFDSAKTGFELSIGLVAAMALWLGLFHIAETAGLVRQLANAASPLLRRLMPEVPAGHPAHASMSLNLAMSMLGLDNAALPSGLKAMRDLEQLNPDPGLATRAQQMFLVYMTTSVTLIPVSILSYRSQMGAAHPADVFVPLLVASYAGLFAGLLYMGVVQRLRLADPVLLLSACGGVLALCGVAWAVARLPAAEASASVTRWGNGLLLASVLLIVMVGWWRRVPVYEAFLAGAAEGFGLAVALIPYVVGMLVAIGLLRNSGAFGLLQQSLQSVCQALGLDAQWVQALPQGLMKSFSGAGARAMMIDTFKTQGPDSFAGHLSAIVQGASDTTFYILATCAGAAKLRHLGHAVAGALVADLISFVVAVWLAQGIFG